MKNEPNIIISDKTLEAPRQPTHSVNYIWLCPKASDDELSKYATRLALHNFERIYVNALRYEEAEFNLWLDFRQLNIRDQFFLNSHRYIFNAARLHVRDLNDIQTYADHPNFDVNTTRALYARADCARVLVLDHILKKHPNTTAIYSDVDCEDLMLNASQMNESLAQYGLTYGCTGAHKMSNNYIAIQGDKGRSFLSDYLLPKTMSAFTTRNLVNLFGSFSDAVRSYRDENKLPFRCNELGLTRLPPMRTAMPYDEKIYGRLNAGSPTRIPGSFDYV